MSTEVPDPAVFSERNTCFIFIIVLLLVIMPAKIVKIPIPSKFSANNLEYSIKIPTFAPKF